MVYQRKVGEEMLKMKRFHSNNKKEVAVLPPVPTDDNEKLKWKKKQYIVWLMQRELALLGDL
jgi:hypothetical protein